MSRRNRASSSRRTKRFPFHFDEDLEARTVSLLATKSTRPRKRSSPQKRNVKEIRPTSSVINPVELITLDDTSDCLEITNNVESKVKTFIESGSFISSDEDEEVNLKADNFAKSLYNLSENTFRVCSKSNIVDCEASTSSALSSSSSKIDTLDDDIMEIVDSVLDKNCDATNKTLTDLKSLEDFRKETEEILQNASKLLDEIKAGKKTEPEKKVEPAVEKSETPTKLPATSCPICLESLSDRSASVTMCGHIFCSECLKQAAKTMKKCPTCRKQINAKKIHPIYL